MLNSGGDMPPQSLPCHVIQQYIDSKPLRCMPVLQMCSCGAGSADHSKSEQRGWQALRRTLHQRERC